MPDIYLAPELRGKKTKDYSSGSKRLDKILSKVNLQPSNNQLASFVALPKYLRFENQAEDENILLFLRPHWIKNIPWILLAILMIISPFVLIVLPLLSSLPVRFQFILVLMWYLFILSFVFEKFLSWYFNVFIITDKRVMDIDFFSLVYREISQAELDKIQDVSYKIGGLPKEIFNFGDVFIQTAAEIQKIEFESVPKPAKVVEVLNKLIL